MVLPRAKVGLKAIIDRQTAPRSDREHLSVAIEWICRSQDVTGVGGSASCYNLVLGWGDAYPETTGYIVPTLFTYAHEANRSEIAHRAIRMADWLRDVQHPDGSYPGGTGEHGDPSAFNTGQIVFGLVAAYRETDEERYRQAAFDACDWLVERQTEGGYWDTYTYKGNIHTYSTRIAWALLEGSTIAENGRATSYRSAARRNFEWAIGNQRPNGWFEGAGFGSDERAFLHTIAYTIRGLLEGGIHLDDAEIVESAKTSADKLLKMQESTGILKGAYDDSWTPSWYYCLTGNAQMALIWLKLYQRTGTVAYLTAARDTIEFLKRRQSFERASQIRGALPGSHPIVGRYMFLRYPNWGVKFFADSLLSIRRCTEETTEKAILD